MINSNPKISVILPVFNAGSYLVEAIESILGQTFQNFEFIICNDGSSDNSLEIILSYAKKDPRIIVISRENHGLVYSLNEMLSMAKGEYIARMDADDISLPARFEIQNKFLDQHPEVVCVGGDVQLIDFKGRYLTTLIPPKSDTEIQQLMLVGHCAITHPAALIRASVINLAGKYDVNYYMAEDLELWLRLGEFGKLANVKEPVIKYRLHSNSISEVSGLRQRDVMRLACEQAWKRRRLNGMVFEGGTEWRPSSSAESRHKFMLQYGWWAWNSKQRKTSMIYALKSIQARFLRKEGWVLLACALFKPFDQGNE